MPLSDGFCSPLAGELVQDVSSMGLGLWGLWKQQKTSKDADSNGFVADEQDKSKGNSKMRSIRWRYLSIQSWPPCDSFMAVYALVGEVPLETLIPFHCHW